MQPRQAERIHGAWAEIAGVPRLATFQVLVRPRSMLGREGWIGVLALGDTLTLTVPERDLVRRIESAFPEAPLPRVTAEEIVARLPAVEVLGPAGLFYPAGPVTPPPPDTNVTRATRDELDDFMDRLSASDLDESGLRDLETDAFAARDEDSRPIAVCGFKCWPANIAHLCVATRPGDRRRGAGRRVARAAMADAIGNGLLPQWRARPEASKALARSLGLEEWGYQMSLRVQGSGIGGRFDR